MKYALLFHLLLTVLFAPVLLRAEGPPISSDGQMQGAYRAFALTPLQQKDLLTGRVITLTEAQARSHGLVSGDRRLFILTSNYNDCTCGLTYGIWFHPDSVALFGEEYSTYDTMENGALMPGRGMRSVMHNQSEEDKMLSFYIAPGGDLYFQGQAVGTESSGIDSVFEKISANLDILNAPLYAIGENGGGSDLHRINIYIPPLRGNESKAKVLETFYLLTMMNSRHLNAAFHFQ